MFFPYWFASVGDEAYITTKWTMISNEGLGSRFVTFVML